MGPRPPPPGRYRALLAEADGIDASLVQIYPSGEVAEVNAAYEVAQYAPGYLLVGVANGFPVLLRGGESSPVYRNDWVARTADDMEELAPSLTDWITRGCPDRRDEQR